LTVTAREIVVDGVISSNGGTGNRYVALRSYSCCARAL
jgi:hypothetical protein